MKKFLFAILFTSVAYGQSNRDFSVSLRLDFSSVEELLLLSDGRISSVQKAASLRGNQIAAATSLALARRAPDRDLFIRELDAFRGNLRSTDDLFGFNDTRAFLPQIRELLSECKRIPIDRRVIATIEQFFPRDAQIQSSIPVYFVAFGHENAAAYVRRVVWNGDTPVFVGEGEGELVIVVNLVRSVQYIQDAKIQFIDMLSTLAHESFHAVYDIYQSSNSEWLRNRERSEPFWVLGDLVQNEGLAYYISLQQHMGGRLSPGMLSEATNAVGTLDKALVEMLSAGLTPDRVRELLFNSNLSGSFEKNYGATAGLLMAYAIDTKMGRNALTETIKHGTADFFAKYNSLTEQYADLPKFSPLVINRFK
jgi:hypothetical protein